jgi:hypothetical protein
MKLFSNKKLGFSISYPAHWEHMPSPWVKQFMSRAKGTSEKLSELIEKYKAPFFLTHDPNLVPGLPINVVKCNVYNSNAFSASGGIANTLLSGQNIFKEAFPDYELLEFEPEFLFAGVVGVKMAMTMSVKNEEGDSFHALSEVFYLPASNYIFAVGFSGTSNLLLRPVSEFEKMQRSIRLK